MKLQLRIFRSNIYCCKLLDDAEKFRTKGIKEAMVDRVLDMALYRAVIFSLDNHCIEQPTIHNSGHRSFTVCQQKARLAAYDNKRFVCADGVDAMLAHRKCKTRLDL